MAVEVLGVYEVPDHPDAVLVEALIDRQPSAIDVASFTQADPNADRSNWQVPYDERYLNADGTGEISQRWATGWSPLPGVAEPATTRLVFFFHFLDPTRPLLTPDGEVPLPAANAMPPRLEFVEYESPD